MYVKSAIFVAFVAFLSFVLFKVVRLYGCLNVGQTVVTPDGSYDYIVVGGGSSGSVVAARLSEYKSNVRVLLLEAGGEETEQAGYHIPGFAPAHLFPDIDWAYQTKRQTKAHPNREPGNEEVWRAGRVLGGGSIINYLFYTRGSRHDYNGWEQAGCTGWGYKDVLSYFLKSEDIQVEDLKDSKYHSTGGFLGVSTAGPSDHPLLKDFIEAGRELGYDKIDHNGEKSIGFGPQYWTERQGVRTSPSRDLLRNAMSRSNLHVTVRAVVTKVIIEGGIAVGVEFVKDNKKRRVMANKEVIISAGTVESAKLLLLSGVGPKQHLQEKGIQVKADLPVGKAINYHLLVPIWANIDDSNYVLPVPSIVDILQYLMFDSGKLASPVSIGVAFTKEDGTKDGKPEFQIGLSPFKFPSSITGLPVLSSVDQGPGLTFVMFSLHPNSPGYLKLHSQDPFDAPILDPNYFGDGQDISRIIAGIRFIQRLTLSGPMKSLNLSLVVNKVSVCDRELYDSDAFWECFIRNVVTGIHYSGTCKMGGASDKTAVVDHALRVKGIKGLRVIDASIMPSSISSNTNAACIMIGEKGADLVLEDLHLRND